MKKIRKAVIPAAGYGTRFLPATKAMPKEMMPIVDKPTIQYVVEDAISAGIEDIILVTGWHKRSIEDHFDYPFELLQRLVENGKTKEADQVKKVAEMANFIYIRQKGPLGNATPILNAKEAIGDEPFIVLWADDFMIPMEPNTPSRCQQLVKAYESYNSTIIAAMRLGPEDAKKYGFMAGNEIEPGIMKLSGFVEKPDPDKMPSPFAAPGGQVYTPDIFQAIEEATRRLREAGENREVVYVDAVNVLIEQGKAVYGCEMKNLKFMDTGTKINYLKTLVEVASRREDLGSEFNAFLKDFVQTI
jgi:UTP--glucose-1-phosphate uridylyltransferase